MLKRVVLFTIILALLLVTPFLISRYSPGIPSSGTLAVKPGEYEEIPFQLSETSNISSTFSANSPIEAFILTSGQSDSLTSSGGILSGFLFASGNGKSETISEVLPSGQYDLAFFNFGSNSSTVSFKSSAHAPSSVKLESSVTVISPGSEYTLAPGQYVALKLHVSQNSSTIQTDFSFRPPVANEFNYGTFGGVTYLMTATQFANFLQSGTNPSSIYSSQSGFFPNALRANVQAGYYYFVTYDPSTTESVNLTLPQGVNITSSSSLPQASASVQLGNLEYLVNFTSTGNVYYIPFGISLNGETQESGLPILFLVRNGTYSWSLESVDDTHTLSTSHNRTVAAGFAVSPVSGRVTVEGRPVNVVIDFRLILYSITFVESGLPSGALWSVSMNVTTLSSITNRIVFNLPNYTDYSFTVIAPQGYVATPSSGIISLEGTNVTKDITFTSA